VVLAIVAAIVVAIVVAERPDPAAPDAQSVTSADGAPPVTARPFGADVATTVEDPVTSADDATRVLAAAAVAQLGELTVAEAVWEGYDRDLFEHWVIDEATGCDTRRLVLIAQAVRPPDVRVGCRLASGVWVSPYDGVRFEGSGAGIEIDHLVPLAEAWRSGAWAWPADVRRAYANDAQSLVAVSAASNQAKLADGPERWLPPDVGSHCWYAAAWVQTKHRWALSVDVDEHDALRRLLAVCAGAEGTDG